MLRQAARLCRQGATAAVPAVRTRLQLAAARPAWQQLQRPAAAHRYAAARRLWTGPTAIATPFPAAPVRREAAVWARPAGAPPLLQRLWASYLDALTRRPLLAKSATSLVCVIIGDSIAQALGGAPYSLARVARLAAFSSTVGSAVGHYWHRWLEARVCPDDPRSARAVSTKVAMDQLILSPVMTAVFFTAIKLLEGRPDAILPFLAEKWATTVATGMAVWTPYNFMSFRFIPQDLRPAAGGAAGIAWNCWLSLSCLGGGTAAPAAAVCTAEAVAQALQAQAAAE